MAAVTTAVIGGVTAGAGIIQGFQQNKLAKQAAVAAEKSMAEAKKNILTIGKAGGYMIMEQKMYIMFNLWLKIISLSILFLSQQPSWVPTHLGN